MNLMRSSKKEQHENEHLRLHPTKKNNPKEKENLHKQEHKIPSTVMMKESVIKIPSDFSLYNVQENSRGNNFEQDWRVCFSSQ